MYDECYLPNENNSLLVDPLRLALHFVDDNIHTLEDSLSHRTNMFEVIKDVEELIKYRQIAQELVKRIK